MTKLLVSDTNSTGAKLEDVLRVLRNERDGWQLVAEQRELAQQRAERELRVAQRTIAGLKGEPMPPPPKPVELEDAARDAKDAAATSDVDKENSATTRRRGSGGGGYMQRAALAAAAKKQAAAAVASVE